MRAYVLTKNGSVSLDSLCFFSIHYRPISKRLGIRLSCSSVRSPTFLNQPSFFPVHGFKAFFDNRHFFCFHRIFAGGSIATIPLVCQEKLYATVTR